MESKDENRKMLCVTIISGAAETGKTQLLNAVFSVLKPELYKIVKSPKDKPFSSFGEFKEYPFPNLEKIKVLAFDEVRKEMISRLYNRIKPENELDEIIFVTRDNIKTDEFKEFKFMLFTTPGKKQ